MTQAFDPVGLIEALEEAGVAYVVIGGIAAGLYGSTRSTYDLDIVPAPDVGNQQRLAQVLSQLHARLKGVDADRLGIELDAETLATGANFTLTTDRGDLDVMPVTEGDVPWEELRRNAGRLELRPDLAVDVVGIDDLIRMKRAAGRRQDIEDIVQLTSGAHLAAHAKSLVQLSGKIHHAVSDASALEAADIATASYEGDVHLSVSATARHERELIVDADLEGFARAHAETWATIVKGKIEASGVLEGDLKARVEAR
jgi:hypothetical protein